MTLKLFIASRGGRWSTKGRDALESLTNLEANGGCSPLLGDYELAIGYARTMSEKIKSIRPESNLEAKAIMAVAAWIGDADLN